MRIFVLAITFGFVLLPTVLILLASHKPLRARILWGLMSFLAPLVIFGAVRLIPLLSNNAADAAQWQRFLGLLLSGSGFVLPWICFAIFAHRQGAG